MVIERRDNGQGQGKIPKESNPKEARDTTAAHNIGQPQSNFHFLRAEWPSLYDEARRAERLAHADPRTSCFYARRVLELAVHWMYDNDSALRPPYQNDLSAMLHEPSMRNLVGPTLSAKMDLIRRQGNHAVHRPAPVQARDAVRTVAELFHVFYWFARTYAPDPATAPAPGVQFDTQRIPRPVPAEVKLRRQAELKKQAEEDQARWDAQAKELAEERAKERSLPPRWPSCVPGSPSSARPTRPAPTPTTTTRPPPATCSSTSSSRKRAGISPRSGTGSSLSTASLG